MSFKVPYLGDTLKKSDTQQKGQFDFASWAVICDYLNKETGARWLPGLRLSPDGKPYHVCGESAAVLIYFREMESGKETPDWIYNITDFRNKPIPLNKLTCADVHNAHKRGIPSAAAGFFSLGFELWAKKELSEIDEKEIPPLPSRTINTQQSEKEPIENPPVEPAFIKTYLGDLVNWAREHPTLLEGLKQAYRLKFPDFDGSFSNHVQEP